MNNRNLYLIKKKSITILHDDTTQLCLAYIYIQLANDNDYAPEYPGAWQEQRKK